VVLNIIQFSVRIRSRQGATNLVKAIVNNTQFK
jgi:hypothetical protein